MNTYTTHYLTRGRLLSIAAFLVATPLLQSQVIINQSFQSPIGELPENWTYIVQDLGVSRGVSEWGIPNGQEYGALFRRSESGQNRANWFYSGTAGRNQTDTGPGNFFDDFSASFTFSMGNSSFAGSLLRSTNTDRTNTLGYWIGLEKRTKLVFSKDLSSHQNPGTVIASADLNPSITLTSDSLLRIDYSAYGKQFTAVAYYFNDELNDWQELASLAATDDTYARGRVGFRSQFTSNNSVYYGSFTMTSGIPEPSTYAALLGAALFGLVVISRHRRK